MMQRFDIDPAFRSAVYQALGNEADAIFKDPERLSELIAEVSVAVGTAGVGMYANGAKVSGKLAALMKVLDKFGVLINSGKARAGKSLARLDSALMKRLGAGAESGGGFGVFGFSEGCYTLDSAVQSRLRSEILSIAKNRKVVRGLLGSDQRARSIFFDWIRNAEVVGTSRAGGVAGLIKLSGESAYKPRIALKETGGFFGLSRSYMIKHELGHIAREASRLANGRGIWFFESRSLFEQERRLWMYPYNATVVMMREELAVARMTKGL